MQSRRGRFNEGTEAQNDALLVGLYPVEPADPPNGDGDE